MAINMNHHVFKGHKTLLGSKYVTYGEVELPTRYDMFSKSSNGFDWGHNGSGPMQLSFSMLFQVSDKDTAVALTTKFTQDVVKKLNTRDWVMSAFEVMTWIEKNSQELKKEIKEELKTVTKPTNNPIKRTRKKKDNVVKNICDELGITQKNLAEILEVPEGTVSSWAVKNEIPRLGKKAIEFYTQKTKNQKIVDSYKNFIHLLKAS